MVVESREGRFYESDTETFDNTFRPKITRREADTLRRLAQRWADARVELLICGSDVHGLLRREGHRRRYEYQSYINVLLYGHTPTQRLYPSSTQGATNSARS